MDQANSQIIDLFEKNTLNLIFYEDSFAKSAFFINIMSKWSAPIFYFDFDLLYSGYVKSGVIPTHKNITLLSPNSDNLHENLKSVIAKISKIKSLVVIDSLNGFFNILENKKDLGRLINSFIMLLTSSAKNGKSIMLVGSMSKLNDENDWVFSNTGKHVIDNDHMTKIQLTESADIIIGKILNPDNSKTATSIEINSTKLE